MRGTSQSRAQASSDPTSLVMWSIWSFLFLGEACRHSSLRTRAAADQCPLRVAASPIWLRCTVVGAQGTWGHAPLLSGWILLAAAVECLPEQGLPSLLVTQSIRGRARQSQPSRTFKCFQIGEQSTALVLCGSVFFMKRNVK